MLIDRIELRHVQLELVRPFETSLGVETHEEHIIVRVDSEGATGWGECVVEPLPAYSPETVATAWHVLTDAIIPSVLGKRFPSVSEALDTWSWVRGHHMAKAGLEAALWDVHATQKQVSLSNLLGGTRTAVDVGVSIGMQESTESMLAEVSTYLQQGYGRIKIKIAPGKDLRYIEAIRQEYPDIALQVDANSAYTLADADIFKAMDNYGLMLIEQPLGYDDIYEHALLQRDLTTPICLDESIHSVGDAHTALTLESCRVINIKPGRVGGFSESIKIHDLCAAQGVPVWHGGMLESGIGRAGNLALASLPNFTLPGDISASRRYFTQDIVDPEFIVSPDGKMTVPTGPGIGVHVLEERLAAVTVHTEEF
ncbi:MAG: o-succinylbenzoate synthase [Fidelibacterota bacterium]|nr:MAG: o-succinylbenzoate synthase [Candidatus Neomarinimicrobiota bacterium]